MSRHRGMGFLHKEKQANKGEIMRASIWWFENN